MSWFEIIAERQIREAQADGVLSNLPGEGRPLNVETDSRQPAEVRIANQILKDAGVLPEWIQTDKDVRLSLASVAARTERFQAYWERELPRLGVEEPARTAALLARRDRFLHEVAASLADVNRTVEKLNLIAPTPGQQRLLVGIRDHLATLESRFPRPDGSPEPRPAPWEAALPRTTGNLDLGNRHPRKRRREVFG